FSRVAGETSSRLRSTRLTVISLTPQASDTSRRVRGRRLSEMRNWDMNRGPFWTGGIVWPGVLRSCYLERPFCRCQSLGNAALVRDFLRPVLPCALQAAIEKV